MIKAVAILVVLLLAGVLIFAATKPDTFRVQRAISIKAPPEKIFPFVNDLHSFGTWSPYEKKDPAMKRTFSGPPSGKGAVYEWEGDKNVGKGRMEIADTAPPSNVTINLDFVKPFEAHNIVVFTLEPRGDCHRSDVVDARAEFPTLRKSCMCFSTWTAWSARISRRVSPI